MENDIFNENEEILLDEKDLSNKVCLPGLGHIEFLEQSVPATVAVGVGNIGIGSDCFNFLKNNNKKIE